MDDLLLMVTDRQLSKCSVCCLAVCDPYIC